MRIRVRCCAICRLDLHVIEGDLPTEKFPVIPGHQIVGIVDAPGANRTRFKIGDRIGIALASLDGWHMPILQNRSRESVPGLAIHRVSRRWRIR